MAFADLKNKAKEAFRRKNYDLAVQIYVEAFQFEANDQEAVEGFFQAAKKLAETRGKGLFGGMFSNVSLGGTRDPMKRMAQCFRALAKNPEHKGTLMSLGEAAVEAGQLEAAIGGYKRAAEVDTTDAEPWKRLGEALAKRGRIPEALAALDNAVKAAPRDQEAIKLRKNTAAEGALKISGFETAKSSRELIKDKDVAQKLETQTRLQLTPEHAAAEITKVLEQVTAEPNNPRVRVRLAELHLQRGDEEAALKAFEEALALDPRNFDLGTRIGDLKLGRYQHAYDAAKKAAAAAPDDAAAKAKVAEATKALIDARLVEYGRRVKEHPLDLAERFKLGRTLLAAGRVEEATGEFQQTVRDPNRKTDSLLLLAKCFEASNLPNLALKKLEEAVADYPSLTNPRAKDVHYEHASLLARTGQKEKARQIFERLYEEDISYRDVAARLKELAPAS
jgi:tetratricopeptide (TPR) repeat protein